MIDHITIRVSNIEVTKSFYTSALQPLGYTLTTDMEIDGVRIIGFGKDGKNSTWFTTDKPVSGPTHFAWMANSQEEVNKFYEQAIKAGGEENGLPGLRPEYHENYYCAFVIDPDGNNIEAVFRN